MMEALADFGSVQLLGVKTFTVAIYQVWFGAFDRLAASQLASFLMLITLLILFAERAMRGRQRYTQSDAGPPLERVRLRGFAALRRRRLFPVLVLAVAFAGPLSSSWSRGRSTPGTTRSSATGSARGRATASCWARSRP